MRTVCRCIRRSGIWLSEFRHLYQFHRRCGYGRVLALRRAWDVI